MSVVLDTPVTCGGVEVATISRVRVVSEGWRTGGMVFADKTPVAVLVRGADGVRALSVPRGQALTRNEVEALCPGAWTAFQR